MPLLRIRITGSDDDLRTIADLLRLQLTDVAVVGAGRETNARLTMRPTSPTERN